MADDIVTRLRHKQRLQEPWDMNKEPIFGEAADEIERLRAEVDLKGYRLDDALDEIKRLRAEVDLKGYRLDDALDEIERLRAEVHLKGYRLDDALDEIERLRAAGDALYELVSVRLVIPADQHDDAVEQIRKWKEARRG